MSDRRARIHPVDAPTVGGADATTIRPVALIEALRRCRSTIVLAGVLAGLAAGLVGLLVPRSHTSTAQLLIDPRGLRVLEKDISPQAREADQSVSVIESEMRFIASDLVLNRVIERAGLLREVALGAGKGGSPSAVKAVLASILEALESARGAARVVLGRSDAPDATPEQAALQSLQRAVKVSRQPSTFVVDIAVTLKDRALAARVADTIASEYIAARFTSRVDVSKRASESINARLEELARQVQAADGAVERYKASNDLVSAAGRLLNESRMGELNTQLQVARAETVRAQSRVAEVKALRAAGSTGEASIEALQSPALERLRTGYALVRQREAALSAQLLPSHPLLRQVRQEVEASQRSINQELARIAETAMSSLERARATERALEVQLQGMKTRVLGEGRALVELRELERVAEAARTVYQTFLVRARELEEQQLIDPSSAVVLAQAEPARAANGPGLLALVAAAGVAGLGLGAAAGLWRDGRDPLVRSALQLEVLRPDDLVHPMPIASQRGLGGLLWRDRERGGGLEYVSAAPGTAAAEAADRLYRALGSIDRRRSGPLVCLVTAAESLQGKSTVALNLALAAARSGEEVLLIDADRSGRTATTAAAARERPGLAEVIDAKTACTAAIMHRNDVPFDLLPAGQIEDLRPTRARLERLAESLLAPLAGYDLVFIDGAIVGRDRLTLALAARSDVALLVVQAGSGRKSSTAEGAAILARAHGARPHIVLVQP